MGMMTYGGRLDVSKCWSCTYFYNYILLFATTSIAYLIISSSACIDPDVKFTNLAHN
jgi:hypothetical protein